MEKCWTTTKGDKIPYGKLKTSHLDNILKYIERKATEGMVVSYGGNGIMGNGPWYDEETIYGADVYKRMDYEGLLAERAKRGRR